MAAGIDGAAGCASEQVMTEVALARPGSRSHCAPPRLPWDACVDITQEPNVVGF